jgi:hypothetical protein
MSWLHFYELTWIASTFNSIGLFFILLYFLFYLTNNKVHFLAEISLVFALLSIEIATIAPLLLLVLLLFWRKIVRKDLVRMTIHLFFVALYLLLRFVFFKIPTTDSYQLGLSVQAMKNLAIYVLWLFNFPEASIVHLKPNSFLLTATDSWFAETFPLFSILLTSSLIYYGSYLIYAVLSIYKKLLKPALFCLLWFIISILPFIVLPKRAYPYYLILAQIGFWIFLSYLLTLSKSKLLSFFFCLLFITTNMFTVNFNNVNHWVHMSSSHATTYYQKYQKVRVLLKDKKDIFWQIDDIFARNALVNGLGFNVFGNNYHQQYFLERSAIPENLRLTTFDLHFYLAKERSKRLHKYFLLDIATPSASLDLWY